MLWRHTVEAHQRGDLHETNTDGDQWTLTTVTLSWLDWIRSWFSVRQEGDHELDRDTALAQSPAPVTAPAQSPAPVTAPSPAPVTATAPVTG